MHPIAHLPLAYFMRYMYTTLTSQITTQDMQFDLICEMQYST